MRDIMVKRSGWPVGQVKVKGKCSPKFIKKDDTLFTKANPLGVFDSPRLWEDTIGHGKLIMMKSDEKDQRHASRGFLLTVSKSGWHGGKSDYQVGQQSVIGYDENEINKSSMQRFQKSMYPERYRIDISGSRNIIFDELTKQQADRVVKNISKSF